VENQSVNPKGTTIKINGIAYVSTERRLALVRREKPSREEVVELVKAANSSRNLVDLRRMDLSGLELNELDLSGADLSNANLSSAYLRKTRLYQAKLIEADLTDAKLFRADLSEAWLNGANLTKASFYMATMECADLSNANLNSANFRAALLYAVNLTGVTGLETAKVGHAITIKMVVPNEEHRKLFVAERDKAKQDMFD